MSNDTHTQVVEASTTENLITITTLTIVKGQAQGDCSVSLKVCLHKTVGLAILKEVWLPWL